MPSPPHNEIDIYPFCEQVLCHLIWETSGASDAHETSAQVRYLAGYLDSLNATTLLVERYYIDRHYMEEVGLYYSRCLVSKPNHCVRIHAFTESLDEGKLDEILSAMTEDRAAADSLLASYLGYIVVRPIPSVPIGRTVLRTLTEDPDRAFTTLVEYPAHFLGLEAKVTALGFQQQDRAVAVCATAAMWSALQRLCRHEGFRGPTPGEIAEAAVRHYLPEGRPFPSSGLTIEQVCEALRYFEFPPDIFKVGNKPDYFLVLLQIYLRSGVPIVLALDDESEPDAGHAVTVVGYRRGDSLLPPPADFKDHNVEIVNSLFEQVYVQDDRIGPYAKALVYKRQKHDQDAQPTEDFELALKIFWPDTPLKKGKQEVMRVDLAVAPLYPKLRSTSAELLKCAAELIPLINAELTEGQPLGVEMFFDRSGHYLSALYAKPVDPRFLVPFQKETALSRYVGVVRWHIDGKPVLDTIWDTTDTLRAPRTSTHLLGAVCLDPDYRDAANTLGRDLKIIVG